VVLRPRYLAAIVGCSLIGVLAAAEMYFWGQVNHRDFTFAQSIVLQASSWLVFAAVAPLVSAWGLRFRLEWPPRLAAIVGNLVAIAATLTLFALVSTVTDHWYGLLPVPEPFWLHFRHAWIYQSPFAIVTYGATVGVAYAAESSRRSRDLARLENELTQAQLRALRMQLNPHFLFNTLHTIAALVREHDERTAVELIERLGDVLRHVLRTSNEHEAPLASEVQFLQQYLEIEQARFGDRLQVSFTIDDGAEHALVPRLIVQPLVENALRHGLWPRAALGRLTVAAQRRNGMLELRVSDDGLGLRDGWDADDGLGLPNVRARLLRMYGGSARLALASPPSGGVVATITLPFRRAADA
jgi:two-component sensor histidine kinase